MQENPIIEQQTPTPESKIPSNVIEGKFSEAKERKTPEQKQSGKVSKDGYLKLKEMRKRKRTADGLAIYTEEGLVTIDIEKADARGLERIQNPRNPRKGKNYYPQYRSKLVALFKLFRSLKLQTHHVKLLKQTPFWFLFEALIYSRIEVKNCRKYDDDVVAILQAFTENRTFQLGCKSVLLRESDIGLIFGIVSGPEPLNVSYGTKPANSKFLERRFGGDERLQGPVIKRKIEEALAGKSKDDAEDFVRLCCLYIFINLLFSTTGQAVSWALFQSVENLRAMKKYAWSKAVLNHLSTSIENKHVHPEKVSGCVMVLLYWLCEHTTLVSRKHEDKFPRFLKWDLRDLHKALNAKNLRKLTRDEVLGAELLQSKTEIQKFKALNKEWEEEDPETVEDEEEDEDDYEEVEMQEEEPEMGEQENTNDRTYIDYEEVFDPEPLSFLCNVVADEEGASMNEEPLEPVLIEYQEQELQTLKKSEEQYLKLKQDLTIDNERLKKQASELQAELNEFRQEKGSLEKENMVLKREKETSEEAIKCLKDKMCQLENQIKHLEKTNEEAIKYLKEKTSQLENQINHLEKTNEGLKSENKNLLSEVQERAVLKVTPPVAKEPY